MRRRLTLAFCLALALGLGACGPIEYVNQVTRRADTAVEEARAANAAKWSPYWWTRAVEYLGQARAEAASADFQAANRFGRLSEEAAIRAREEALLRASDPDAARELEVPDAPPKKKNEPTMQNRNIAAYSSMKKKDQRMPEYSVMKPATSSDSASGRSKGARFVSARMAMKNSTKAGSMNGSIQCQMYQFMPQ